jgi:hypothetical protein
MPAFAGMTAEDRGHQDGNSQSSQGYGQSQSQSRVEEEGGEAAV